MAVQQQIQYISLVEIDENIIPKIRELNEDSDAFHVLSISIKDDGQRHPITLRRLSESEKKQAKSGATYGIIDGHHRFKIARANNQLTIPAIILTNSSNTDSDIYSDVKLALRLNEGSIKMSPTEKGRLLHELAKSTGRNPVSLAGEIFGFKSSMAYRCLNAYRKSIGEVVVSKPRKTDDFQFKNLKKAWGKISRTLPRSADERAARLNDLILFEKELRRYKRFLSAQSDVSEEIDEHGLAVPALSDKITPR